MKRTHGLSRHPLYYVWQAMKMRCYNENYKDYKYYGAKGVKMCDEWFNDFEPFYKWAMNNGYKKGLQVDKDIKGIGKLYGPDSCVFVTPKINSQYASKLNYDIVEEIRKTYKLGLFTLKEIGIAYNMCSQNVSFIVNKKRWK